jgi:hypothetical protein
MRPAKDNCALEMFVLIDDTVDGDLQALRHLCMASGWPRLCPVLLLGNVSAEDCMHGERR